MLFVAAVGEVIVGCVGIRIVGDNMRAEIQHMAVSTMCRRQGLYFFYSNRYYIYYCLLMSKVLTLFVSFMYICMYVYEL